MKILQDILTTEEISKFLKFPKLIQSLPIELQNLTIKQALEAGNVIGQDLPTFIGRIAEELAIPVSEG